MLLRKINAIVSLFTTFFLLVHAVSTSVWMLSKGSIQQGAPWAPWILAGLMAVHAFISIDFAISSHMNSEKRKCKSYPQLNRVTIFQRISGVFLIIFTVLHITGATGVMTTPHTIHTIVPPIFFAISLAHAAVSTDKAFITLGIGNAKSVKAVSVVVKLVCTAVLIAAVAGFYLYVW